MARVSENQQAEYSDLVREFYSTLKEVVDETTSVKLKGFEHLINLDTVAEAHCISNLGSKISNKGDVVNIKGYNETTFKRVLGKHKVKDSDGVISSQMKLHNRAIHKLVTSYISPKNGYVNTVDLWIIWHIQKQRYLNLCCLMMENMKAVIKNRGISALSYGMVLTELFRFLGVDLSKEVYTNVSKVV